MINFRRRLQNLQNPTPLARAKVIELLALVLALKDVIESPEFASMTQQTNGKTSKKKNSDIQAAQVSQPTHRSQFPHVHQFITSLL